VKRFHVLRVEAALPAHAPEAAFREAPAAPRRHSPGRALYSNSTALTLLTTPVALRRPMLLVHLVHYCADPMQAQVYLMSKTLNSFKSCKQRPGVPAPRRSSRACTNSPSTVAEGGGRWGRPRRLGGGRGEGGLGEGLGPGRRAGAGGEGGLGAGLRGWGLR